MKSLMSRARFVEAGHGLGLSCYSALALWEAGNGLTDKEACAKYGIKKRCHEERVARALAKLDALNRAHAVLLVCSKIIEEDA